MSKHLKKRTKRADRFLWKTLATLLVATLIVAIAAVTVASRRALRARSSPQTAKANAEGGFVMVKVAGQDVQVNGKTGQIKELSAEETQKLAAGLKRMVNQSTEGLEQEQHADGSVSMDLKGRFQNVTVARINKDGSLTQSCVENPESAGAFFGIDPKLIQDP